MHSQKKVWKAGDRYTMMDCGELVTGTIIRIYHSANHQYYVVEWSNGKTTVEDKITPMSIL